MDYLFKCLFFSSLLFHLDYTAVPALKLFLNAGGWRKSGWRKSRIRHLSSSENILTLRNRKHRHVSNTCVNLTFTEGDRLLELPGAWSEWDINGSRGKRHPDEKSTVLNFVHFLQIIAESVLLGCSGAAVCVYLCSSRQPLNDASLGSIHECHEFQLFSTALGARLSSVAS